MRLGAAIIVVIALMLVPLIISGRTSRPSVLSVQQREQFEEQQREQREEQWKEHPFLVVCSGVAGAACAGMGVAYVGTILALVVWFFKASVRESGLPCDEPLRREEHILKLRALVRVDDDAASAVFEGAEEFPFQFGVITLLALMVAVAIVCAAFTCPLGN